MRALIDATFMADQTSSIGLFQRMMTLGLIRKGPNDAFHVLTDAAGASCIPRTVNCSTVVLPSRGLRARQSVARSLCRDYDVSTYFATFNIAPILPSRVKLVLQNHDFSHGVYDTRTLSVLPGRLYRYLHVRSIRRAAHLLANSDFTANQVKQFSGSIPITTIYHDCDPVYRVVDGKEHLASRKDSPTEPLASRFVLYAGRSLPTYKNVMTLLKAYEKYSAKFPSVRLHLVISDGLTKTDEQFVERLGSRVSIFRNIDSRALAAMYRSAEMVVYPSLYEGFGMPILEAQNSGVPLIVSTSPPMPEIAGAGSMFFRDEVELFRAMCMVSSDPQLRSRLVEQGLLNAKRFDWQTTIDRTYSVLSEN